MKSKYFKNRSIGLIEKQIKSLETLSKLPTDVLNEIARWINKEFEIESRKLHPYFSSKDRIDQINNLCVNCEISDTEFFDVFIFTRYIVRRIYELDDNLDDVIDDFVSQKFITEENKEKIIKFFQAIKEKLIELAKQFKKDLYESKTIPTLDSMDYSVNLRLVPKTPFELFNTPIEDYQPKAEDLTLSSIIEIITVDGENTNVSGFQLNFFQLEEFIVKLQACQKEMRLLQAYYEKYDITKM